MKKLIVIVFSIMAISCTLNESKPYKSLFGNGKPTCPKEHTDSLIPILYGMPTEESFLEADSGKIWLGGCELPEIENNWYCKKHNIQF